MIVCVCVCMPACVWVAVCVSNPWARLFLGSGTAFLSPFSAPPGSPTHTVDVKVMSVLS